jgi:UDP-3-O-[3-hydroxymyristoyl] N-acetylglucosamine deacetylase
VSYDRIDPVVGSNNTFTFKLDDDLHDIANARTFGWIEDIERIRASGFGLGASEENTIGITKDNTIVNEGGLRHPKELVLHKCLDLIGDIAVIGYDIIGKIECLNPSHLLNNILMRKLLNEIETKEISGVIDCFH